MKFFLASLDISVLFMIHANVYEYKITLKRLVLNLGGMFLWAAVSMLVSTSLGVDFFISILLYPSYFIVYTYYLQKNWDSKAVLLFFALFPLTFMTVMNEFIINFVVSNIDILEAIYKSDYGISLFSVLSGSVVLLFIRIFQYDFSYLRKKTLNRRTRTTLIIANSSMFLYFILIPYMGYIESVSDIYLSNYRELIISTFIVLFICFVNILDRNLRQELQEQVVLQKEIQLENLKAYSQKIEGLYQDVRGFRHDYVNILTSLRVGIDAKDIQMISDVYHSVLKESGKMLKGKKFDIARLRNISDLPLKSLLVSTLSEAESLAVTVSLEIPQPISIRNIEVIDFLTIVSILLDNAIEAARESTVNPEVVVCFFEDRRADKQVLIIQNATLEKEINVTQIFKRGVSSKGQGRGLGLANVNEILRAYPNVSMKTTSYNFVFKQILEIK